MHLKAIKDRAMVHYLHSHIFNPIEGTFSVLKAVLRSGASSDLETALAAITANKCQAFFRQSKAVATRIAAGDASWSASAGVPSERGNASSSAA